MPATLPDLSRAAVLSMDLQSAIVSIYTRGNDKFLPRIATVQQWARSRVIPVIHVRMGFRPGMPEVSMRNPLVAAIKNNPQWRQLFEGAAGEIHPSVAPEADEIVIAKHRISAFTGTDLDMILRAKEIDTLILMGIATSGVVLATLYDATGADYSVVLVKDCCSDLDAEVHSCLTGKVFARMATVVSAGELTEAARPS